MKSIINYINEKLKINSQDIDLGYKYFPKDQYELRELISDHILAQAKETHTSVDLSDIDVSKITDMSKLFYKFDYLEKINVSGWDISNVETLESCFAEMKNLKEINGLDDWDLSKVKNINAMFYKCKSLTKLDLSGWDTKSIISMDAVFSYCENLKEIIGIEYFNVSKVKSAYGVFIDCKKLNCNLNKWKFKENTTTTCFRLNADGIRGIVLNY